jgi:hypothetical protein
LTEADSEGITPLVAGSVVQTRGTRAAGLTYNLNVVLFDKDGNTSTTNDQVKASGSLNLKPIFDLELSLDCGFLCIYDNDLDFKFALGLEERAALKIITGCDPRVTFSSNGARTLTLTGTDARGATATSNVSVNVIDPPANLPPVANISKPLNNIFVGPDQLIDILGTAADPEGGAVTLSYDITYPYDLATGTGIATQVITVPATGKWKPSDSITFSSCEVDMFVRLRLHAKDPQNNDGTDFVVIRVNRIC